MSLKAELETWDAALKAYDAEEYMKSIQIFDRIADTSRIVCNIGLIYAALGEHEIAVENFSAACSLDPHLAIGYFQKGVSNFLLRRYQQAHDDFEETLVHLRSNQSIDYEQLGLKFQLWRPEVLFNKGLCQINMGRVEFGMRDLEAARQDKGTEEHDVIDTACRERGAGYTVFSIPIGVLYRPSESKLRGVKSKDYLGKAKLVAASEKKDAFTEFVGARRLQEGLGPAGQRLERPPLIQLPRRSSSLSGGRTPQQSRKNSAAPSPVDFPRSVTPSPIPSPDFAKDMQAKLPQPDRPPSPIYRSVAFGPNAERDLSRATITPPSRPRTADGPEPSNRGGMSPRTNPSGVPIKRSNTVTTPGYSTKSIGSEEPRRPSPLQNQQPPKDSREYVDRPRARGFSDAEVVRSRSTGPPLRRVINVTPPLLPPPPLPLGNDASAGGRAKMRPGLATELYEDSLGPYGAVDDGARVVGLSEPTATATIKKVATWTNETIAGAPPDIPPSRTPSQRAVRRAPSRKLKQDESNESGSQYEEDVAPGNFDQAPMRIRVKIHYQDDVRGMAVSLQTTFQEFTEMISIKFGKEWEELRLKFRDEDGGKISLKDGMDWDMAVEVARGTGGPLKALEVWLMDG